MHISRPVRQLPVLALSAVFAIVTVGSAPPGATQEFKMPAPANGTSLAMTDRLIVKYRIHLSPAELAAHMRALGDAAVRRGITAFYLRAGALDTHVTSLDRMTPLADVERLAREVALSDAAVESAEPDRIMQVALVPNDPLYNQQWHYYEATAGINLPGAWDLSTGSGVTVAVLDTGYRPHADLVGNITGGYNFVLRVSDAQDPDGCGYASWHGTHVAGTIAAVTNNGAGVAGVAFNAKVVPVRVLACAGGYESDIADGIVWASGGSVPGVPANANPARVLNLSLGGTGPCSATYQNAINSARSRNAVVVAAAGNLNADAANFTPANCGGVIAVAAVDRSGGRTSYSNYGTTVKIAAPGGNTTLSDSNGVLSTSNSGLSAPGADSYAFKQGTSMAAPHVAGVVALMIAVNSPLTPDGALAILQNTARPFPVSCSECGSGIVNAQAAVNSAALTPESPWSIDALDYYACPWTTVSWSAVSGATSYELWRSNQSAPAVRSYAGPGLQSNEYVGVGALVRFKATACNANGCSALSTATASAYGVSPCP